MNAIILVLFVSLLTYSAFKIVKVTTDNQFNDIKDSITGSNKKMLLAFVKAQSVSLDKEVELIMMEAHHISDGFSRDYFNTKELRNKQIISINKNLKPFIEHVSFIDIKNNLETKVVGDDVTEVDNALDLSKLIYYKGLYIGKEVESGAISGHVTEFSIYVPLEHWSHSLLKLDLNLNYFENSLAFKSMFDDLKYRYFLVDDQGKLIASNLKQNIDELMAYLSEHSLKEKSSVDYIMGNDSGSFTVVSDNKIYSITFLLNKETGWRLILVTPESVINSSFFTTKELILSADISLIRTFSIESMVLLLLFLLINYLTINKLLSPISKLIVQASSLKHRDFDKATSVVDSNGDEIEELSQVYCEAGNQIKVLIEGLETEVEERTKLYELAMKEAKEANSHKSILLSNVSHEVRTPLNAIIGYTQMLSNINSQDIDRHHLDGISTASHMILDIVNDLLDLERIHASNYTLHPKPIALNKLTNELKTTFLPLAQSKKLAFNVDTSAIEDSADLYVDPLRFKQAMSNIVSNAIKFTSKGMVALSTYVDIDQGQHCLVFSVKDTGVGIPEDKIDSIFKDFVQVNQGDQLQGFGLGLAITRTIVNLMDGKIVVNSVAGEGTEFKVLLPIDILNFESEPTNTRPVNHVVSETGVNYTGMTALIVDDVEFNREVLQYHLINLGFECHLAQDGIEALDAASQHRIDVVLTDISMPNMDGVELANKLKASQYDLPIIAVTARATVQEESRLRHHFDAYLTKPIDINDLSHSLRCALFGGVC